MVDSVPSVGVSFAHTPSNNYEYNVGASLYLNNTAYQGGLEYWTRINYRLKWTNKKNPKLSYGIAGNFMYNKDYEFFYWQDNNHGVYKASAGQGFEKYKINC